VRTRRCRLRAGEKDRVIFFMREGGGRRGVTILVRNNMAIKLRLPSRESAPPRREKEGLLDRGKSLSATSSPLRKTVRDTERGSVY